MARATSCYLFDFGRPVLRRTRSKLYWGPLIAPASRLSVHPWLDRPLSELTIYLGFNDSEFQSGSQ